VRRIGEMLVRAWPDLSITSIWSGGTALMTSTPPAISSAIWVACSGMIRTRTCLKKGLGPQYSSLRTSRCSRLRLQLTSL
jgi:hypothetical protein